MEKKKKYPTPRGDAANRAKNKYRSNNYDQFALLLPKGEKEKYKAAADAAGEPLSSWIFDAMQKKFYGEGIKSKI